MQIRAIGEGSNQELTNDSKHDVIFKPDKTVTVDGLKFNENGAYRLKPGNTWSNGFDGVYVPHIRTGVIFKVVNGVSLVVMDNGMKISGINGALIFMELGNYFPMSFYTGGWKGE